MSEKVIIQYLISGLHPRLKREISRHEPSMKKPAEFLTRAKLEHDLQDTFEKTCHDHPATTTPYFMYDNSNMPSITAAIQSPARMYHAASNVPRPSYYTSSQSFVPRQNSFFRSTHRPATTITRSSPSMSKHGRNSQQPDQGLNNCPILV